MYSLFFSLVEKRENHSCVACSYWRKKITSQILDVSLHFSLYWYEPSVVDPNTLNLDQDSEFCPILDLDPDPDQGLSYQSNGSYSYFICSESA